MKVVRRGRVKTLHMTRVSCLVRTQSPRPPAIYPEGQRTHWCCSKGDHTLSTRLDSSPNRPWRSLNRERPRVSLVTMTSPIFFVLLWAHTTSPALHLQVGI